MLLSLNDTSDMKCQDQMPDDTEIKLPIQDPSPMIQSSNAIALLRQQKMLLPKHGLE